MSFRGGGGIFPRAIILVSLFASDLVPIPKYVVTHVVVTYVVTYVVVTYVSYNVAPATATGGGGKKEELKASSDRIVGKEE